MSWNICLGQRFSITEKLQVFFFLYVIIYYNYYYIKFYVTAGSVYKRLLKREM